jgi:hypothetical protein
VTDPRIGNQLHDALHHAEPRAQNRDEGDSGRDLLATGQLKRCLHLDCHGGKITGDLVGHQGGDLSHQLLEVARGGAGVPEQSQFVANQRVVKDQEAVRSVGGHPVMISSRSVIGNAGRIPDSLEGSGSATSFRILTMRRLGTILIMAATWLACTPAPPQPADTRLTPAHAEAMTDSIEDGVVRYRSRAEVADAIRELAGSVRRTELLMDGTIITPLAPGVAAVTTGFAQKVEDHEGRVGGFAGAISMVLVHREEGWQFQFGHTSSGAPTGE